MLKIHYGPMDGAIFNIAVYFKNVYQDAWLEDDFAKRMIAGVDKSKVVGLHLIETAAPITRARHRAFARRMAFPHILLTVSYH